MRLRALAACLALLPAVPAPAAGPARIAAAPAPSGAQLAPGHGGDTRCAACHTADGWTPVKFAHERTGFPLDGAHRDAACKACHASGTFADPVPRACSACHRDVHLGRLGQRCQTCHEPTSWATASFSPDAHRRTSFPLTGRHALIPCESCHGDKRDRGFSRPLTGCIGCHQADWAKATSAAAAIDHATAGFPEDCRGCHGAWRFAPAGFPAHQACFDLRSGPHAGIRCLDCHTDTPPFPAGGVFTCAGSDFSCIRCHTNAPAQHTNVQGFQNVDRKCYECHRFSNATGAVPGVFR
ncbi:MAG TPA: cytochrome C [Anaeromyxobacter sp.]|nr:cytochrome C [Anaeromyxobacter sp.]